MKMSLINILKGGFPILLSLLFSACGLSENKEQTKAKLTNITESVYASAKVIPKESYSVQANRSGIIDSIYVNEGDLVKENDILFQISVTADINNKLRNAELSLEEAEANLLGDNNLLENIQAEIETKKEQLIIDSLNFKRYERLIEKNIGKKVDYEQAKLKYESTKNQLTILKKKYAQTRTSLETQYKKAKRLLDAEKTQLEYYTVQSSIKGLVYTIHKEAGEYINMQESFAEIGSEDHYIIQLDIDEVDITKIELGDTVIITLDAYPDQVYPAIISKIPSVKDNAKQTFQVESIFKKKPNKLYNGLAGEANIIVDYRKNVMVIPAGYLIEGNKVLTDEGELRVNVGIKNLKHVEITSGIDTNTVLVKASN